MQENKQYAQLLNTLETRFIAHPKRHIGIQWSEIKAKLLLASSKILEALQKMEDTGGEPDVIEFNSKTGELVFCDFSQESPVARRNLCYDDAALQSRKTAKPKGSAVQMAEEMGVRMLDETWYRKLQQYGDFDTKTSSWIQTPEEVRQRGGAEFSDKRYGKVYVYHNGAESYYASRGFRALLRIM
jgi:hypothetical protein